MFSLRARSGFAGLINGALAAVLGTALLAGCGGSDSDTPASTTTSAGVSVGTITGFSGKSVIVNGMAYDQSAAKVVDDDGSTVAASALKVGMQVEVQCSSMDRGLGFGRAANIAFGSAVLGPVDSVDTATNTLKVLGQTIQVSDATVLDADFVGGLAGVTPGAIVNVFGLLDAASGVTTATRIDLKDAAKFFRLRGVVSSFDLANRTLLLGGQLVSFANIADADLPAGLADGQVVRAVLETAKVNDAFVARRIKADRRFVADGAAVDIEAIVTKFTSNTSFEVFGLLVDATNATFVNEAGLKRGAKVQVQGALTAGVLVATNVEVKLRQKVAVVNGAVSALDATAKTFVVDGVTVDFSGDVKFFRGDATTLVDGVNVLVKGVLAADGTTLTAQKIAFLP